MGINLTCNIFSFLGVNVFGRQKIPVFYFKGEDKSGMKTCHRMNICNRVKFRIVYGNP